MDGAALPRGDGVRSWSVEARSICSELVVDGILTRGLPDPDVEGLDRAQETGQHDRRIAHEHGRGAGHVERHGNHDARGCAAVRVGRRL